MLSNSRPLQIGKGLYFFLFAAVGILVPFLNVYYKSIGLSGTQIGMISTIGPLIAIFSGPAWGMLADRLGKMRLLLACVVVGAAVTALGMRFATTLGAILLIVAAFSVFSSALIPLVDSYNIMLLGEHRERYSDQRLWGTIGFLATSTFSGFVLEKTGLQAIFFGYVVCLLFFLFTLAGLPPMPARVNQAVFAGFKQMLRRPVWIIMAITAIMLMLANNSWVNFLGITMKQMGGSDGLIGIVWSIGAFVELPVMWYGTRLLYRLGTRNMMLLGFLFYGLRMLFYALMPSPEWAMAIAVLHSVTFGFYWIGSVNYVSEIAPEELRATGQSLLAAFFNIARALGAPMMGWIFDHGGPTRMFTLAALIVWGGAIIFWAGTKRFKTKPTPSQSSYQ